MIKDPNSLTEPAEYVSWREASAWGIPQPSAEPTDDVHLTNYQLLLVQADRMRTTIQNLERERDMLRRTAVKARKLLKEVL